MDGVILYPKSEGDFEAIKKLAEQLNISSEFLPQEELEFLERKKLAEAAETWYPQADITMDEIVSMVKETRAEIYARKNLHRD